MTSSISFVVTFRVLHGLLHRPDATFNEVRGELVERGPHQIDVQVLRSGCVSRDERQVDRGLGDCRQLDLGLLRGLEEALQRLRVIAQVDAVGLLELIGEVVDDPAVEVVAAQMRVASRRHNLDDPFADGQNADVESAAAKIEDENRLVLELVHAVRQRSCGGLIDDPQDLQAGDPSGVLGRLPLCVVEMRRHRDHGFGDPFTKELASVLHQLAQHLCRDFLRCVLLAIHLEPCRTIRPGHDIEGDRVELAGDLVVLSADEPLRGVDGALRDSRSLVAWPSVPQAAPRNRGRRPPTVWSDCPRHWR